MKECRKLSFGLVVWALFSAFICAGTAGAVDFPFSDDMESGGGGWAAENPWTLAAENAHSGDTAWTDSPGGPYANDAEVALTLSSAVDLSAAESPKLVFWHLFHFESSYDFGYVDVSTDGGTTWMLPVASFTGNQSWRREQIDLGDLAGEANVRIRFRLKSDKSLTQDGWTIDDVSIADPPNEDLSIAATLSDSVVTTIQLSWNEYAGGDFSAYQIYRSESEGVTPADTLVATLDDKAQTAFDDIGLASETTYFYQVFIVNDHGVSAPGGKTEASATTGIFRYTYPFSDDFEGSVAGWNVQSPWGRVDLPAAESHSGTASKVWTDSPAGTYAADADTSLQFSINLGASSVMPVMSFWHTYSMQADHDWGYVEIQEVGSSDWTRIYAVTGNSASWVEERIDLSSYAGKEVNLRFRFTADGATESNGWFIDDVRIGETESDPLTYPFFDDLEDAGSADNWHSGSWELAADYHSETHGFTDSPQGKYGYQVDSHLVLSNVVDLSDADNPRLSFWHKYDTADLDNYSWYDDEFDYCRVYISPHYGHSGTWVNVASFKGQQNTWKKQIVDIGDWKGQSKVRIKFVIEDRIDGDGNANRSYTNGYTGWTIDDVAIEEAPTPVALSITASSQNSVNLSWTPNDDTDFGYYEIRRGTAAGVTRSSTLVKTIADAETTSSIDHVAMVQPGTYFYKIWVIDQYDNVSPDSNEVQAAYTIPGNGYPFQENGESGTSKWSRCSPWGLTDASAYEGTFAWTDSPGANYAANADTTLATRIDLSSAVHPVLTFWHHYSLEENQDYVRLEVSTDNGQNWTQLYSFTGIENEWNQERINLSAYAGTADLGLRFRLTANDSTELDGWYMDDLQIVEAAVAADYPFFDDMESGVSPWFYSSAWRLKSVNGRTGETTTAWTDSPEGSYKPNENSFIQLTIDLGTAVMPVLGFWHRYSMEADTDWGYVEIRQSGTSNWQRIYMVTGTSTEWLEERVDLSSHAGNKLDIRFLLTSNDSTQNDGWLIDDIRIGETQKPPLVYPFRDGFDSADTMDHWHSGSWDRVNESHSGKAFTDSPKGKYGYQVKSALVLSNVIDLTDAVHPRLTFWQKYQTANLDNYSWYDDEHDYCRVYISDFYGHGGTWVQVGSFKGEADWSYSQLDLTYWAGQPSVRIQFVLEDSLDGDGNANRSFTDYGYDGWRIDDIAIEEAPTALVLSITNSSQNSVSLEWTQNSDADFGRYEIRRSTLPDVDRGSTLISTIDDVAATTYTDAVAPVQPGKYYYKVWALDQDGNVSPASNEVVATYTIPSNGFPFVEDSESGPAKWSSGSPWGLSDESANSGIHAWTDSPGANYAANTDTSMDTCINLTGANHPVLTFWHRYFLEDGKDYLRIEVTSDNGQTWTALRSITGTEANWNQERIDLSNYAGNAAFGLRFRLTSDGANQLDGWYVDDLHIVEEPIQATYPFFDDLESGIAPWFYGSPWGLTALSAEESYNGLSSTVWTDSPQGSYRTDEDSSLQITIDLGTARMPVLTFWHRYSFQTNQDWGYVEVRESGGSWTRLYALTGAAASWLDERVDLTGYAGKKVDIRFRLVSDGATQNDGWYIDDIRVGETQYAAIPYPFADDMDGAATADNWHSSSWQRVNATRNDVTSKAFTDSPEGKYGYTTQSELVLSNVMDLSKAVHPKLTFWHKYETANLDNYSWYDDEYDYCRVYISDFYGHGGTYHELANYKGESDWTQASIDLSNYAGLSKIRIKFVLIDSLDGDGNANRSFTEHAYTGWTLDDVRIGEDTTIPTYILKTGGDGQHGQTGQPLDAPFTAAVYTQDSVPAPGIPVTFAVTGGDGTISTISLDSDLDGQVSTILTLGPDPVENTVSAAIDGTDESVTFSATGWNAGQPFRLDVYAGDHQSAEVDTDLAQPFVVKVTDIGDDLVAGVDIAFAVLSGNGGLDKATAATDAGGLASSLLTFGIDPGEVRVNASAAGLIGSPVLFTAYSVLPGGVVGDMDGDGASDDWETANNLNRADADDAALDPDADDLTNYEEFQNNTDPNEADTDGDGMPDGWEITYGLDPNDYTDAYDDHDGDGVDNVDEYDAGTAPAFERHFFVAGATDESMLFYGNLMVDSQPAKRGDEVAALDPDGVVCGVFRVTTTGEYGLMNVYRDDPLTGPDEGAQPGDELTFRIWDADKAASVDATADVVTGTDPPTWTGADDTAEVNVIGSAAQRIPLQSGWNLISFSIKKCFYVDDGGGAPNVALLPGTVMVPEASVADILISIDGKYDLVRSFDADGAHTFDPGLPEFSDLTYMAGGYGYWIKMNTAGTLEIYGMRAAAADTLTLHNNWNLVGCWHPDVQYTGETEPLVDFPADVHQRVKVDSIDTVVAAISGAYSVIRSFDSTSAHTYDPLLPAFNDLEYMGLGYGFWIKMKNAGTLHY